jgi:NAD(P)-dependent dehydrogenase (short-subunit alcohol dehydrogenase family)
VQSALSSAVKQFGSIDIVVNNAGYLDAHEAVASSDISDYWRCYEVNVKAGIIVLQEFLRRAKPGATFINISSGAAHVPFYHGFSAYVSSKMAFARVCELAQGENPEVRIFSVQPGSIETDMARKVSNVEETLGMKVDDDIGMSRRVMVRDGAG